MKLRIDSVDKDASRVLSRPELTVTTGGHLVAREKAGQIVPERAVFRVVMSVEDTASLHSLASQSWRGRVTIHARAEAPALRYVRQAGAVLWREMGF